MNKLAEKGRANYSTVFAVALAQAICLIQLPCRASSPEDLADQISRSDGNPPEDYGVGNEEKMAPSQSVETKSEPVNSPPGSSKLSALTLSYGRFATGRYTPYQPVNTSGGTSFSWEPCSAITLCTSDGLYGNILSLAYTRRFYNGRRSKLDIDFQAAYANQPGDRFSRGTQAYTVGQYKSFGLLSIVPTYRLKLPKPFDSISVGAGAGVNVSTSTVPSEQPYDIPFNSQVNLEVALSPFQDKSVELIFALQHRCSFFGALNNVDGKLTGTQWWSTGIRKWF